MMNTRIFFTHLLLSILPVIWGCSSQSGKSPQANGEAKQLLGEGKKVMWDKAGERIDRLADSAREMGPEALNYLTSDLFMKADLAARYGDQATAIFLYESLLRIVPKDVFIQQKYAIELVRSGQLQKARNLLIKLDSEKALTKNKVKFILAGLHLSENDVKSAQVIYRGILKKDPSHSEACIFLSKTYFEDNQFKRAHKRLDMCQKKDKKNPSFAYYRGKFYLEKDKLSLANKFFQKAWKISPDFHQAALGTGLIYEEKKQYEKAMKTYRKYLGIDPHNKPILSRLVNLLFAESRFDEVLSYAEALSSLEPKNLNLKVKLGILYSDNKQHQKALTLFKEIESIVPNSDKILYYIGSIYQEIFNVEQAVNYYNKIPVDSPLFRDAHIQISELLASLASEEPDGKFASRFFDHFERTVGKLPALEVPMHVIRANYFEKVKDYSSAISTMKNIREHKEYSDNQDYYLALLYEKNGEFNNSISVIEDILNKNPNNAHALNFLGYSYLERGVKMDKAYDYIKMAVSLMPEDGFIRDSLGWYYYQVGNYQKALKQLTLARKYVTNDGVISKHLGLIYQKLQQFSLAEKHFNEALGFVQNENDKQEIDQLIQNLQSIRLPASR